MIWRMILDGRLDLVLVSRQLSSSEPRQCEWEGNALSGNSACSSFSSSPSSNAQSLNALEPHGVYLWRIPLFLLVAPGWLKPGSLEIQLPRFGFLEPLVGVPARYDDPHCSQRRRMAGWQYSMPVVEKSRVNVCTCVNPAI